MASWFSKELFINCNDNVLVFGSNLGGRHSKGAAKFAKIYCGAQYGNGFGLQGKSFAIPTKDEWLKVLPLEIIEQYIRQFLHFAIQHPKFTFYVTEIGCSLTHFEPIQIAPMFINSPSNVILPTRFKYILNEPVKLTG